MRTRTPYLAQLGLFSLISACSDGGSSDRIGTTGGTDASLDASGNSTTGGDAEAPPDEAGAPGFNGGPGSVKVVDEGGLRVATITTSSFIIAPGEERYICQNFENPYGQDVAVVKSSSTMTGGSHHMFAFQKQVGNAALEDCSGLEFGPAVHSAQAPKREIVYPDGIARALKASDGLRIQAHYLNVTDKPITAEVKIVLQASTDDSFQLAASLFFNNLDLSVPAKSKGSAERTCTLPQDIELMNAVSHMHSFGTHFVATLDDSTVLYETDEWSDPVARVFDPPLKLKAGTKITYRCDYDNTSKNPLRFGESARTDEMCILLGQFYPSADGAGITCM